MKYFFLFFFILISTSCHAALFTINAPKDKTITNQEVVNLSGTGGNLKALTVNGKSLDIKEDGFFSCGLILNPGKNYIDVMGWGNSGKFESRPLRILRLISFPDAEIITDNKKHWARREIIALATLGILEGYPDGNFYMAQPATRGEIATWIVKEKGFFIKPAREDVYIDVPKEHWRAPYIKAAVENKIMGPVTPTLFGIDNPLTRGEAAFITFKAEGKNFIPEIDSVFNDVPSDYPFYSEIIESGERGLLKGISLKTAIFEPNRAISRAETAILISRFSRVKKLDKLLFDFSNGYNPGTYCLINTPPKITSISANPSSFSLFEEGKVISLTLAVEDQEGPQNILSVKADLSNFNGAPDAEMRKTDADGIYNLQFVGTSESWGEKVITATATDKWGSTGSGSISITVVR